MRRLDEIGAGYSKNVQDHSNAEKGVQGGQIDELSEELSGNIGKVPLLADVYGAFKVVNVMPPGRRDR